MSAIRAALLAIALATTVPLLGGCLKPAAIQPPAGVQLTPLRTISSLEAKGLLRLAGVNGMPVADTVDCYRMTYSITGPDGRPQRLSGLLALPRGVAPRRLVSFQHGTTTVPADVPSKPDTTGLAAAVVFAGNGYALIAPDYPGLGVSRGKHPYMVEAAIGPAVVGMIDAALRLPGMSQAPVFLGGFSEGGWASLAALQRLEAQGRTVLGSAQVAGPYDLRNLSIPNAMTGASPQDSTYLAYVAWGQAAFYGQRLDSALTPANAALVNRLFGEGAEPDEMLKSLPTHPRDLFNAQFLDAYDHGGKHWLLDSFTANSLTAAAPHAPVRLYYGSRDTDVSPREAVREAQLMKARGVNVTVVDVGPVDHNGSMLAAAPLLLPWLRQLETGG